MTVNLVLVEMVVKNGAEGWTLCIIVLFRADLGVVDEGDSAEG